MCDASSDNAGAPVSVGGKKRVRNRETKKNSVEVERSSTELHEPAGTTRDGDRTRGRSIRIRNGDLSIPVDSVLGSDFVAFH